MSRLFYCSEIMEAQLPTEVVSWGASPIGLLSRSRFEKAGSGMSRFFYCLQPTTTLDFHLRGNDMALVILANAGIQRNNSAISDN